MIEKILCSAIYFDDGKVYTHVPRNIKTGYVVTGYRHCDCYQLCYIFDSERKYLQIKEEEGFLTSLKRFVSREEAFEIAKNANQIKDLNNTRSNKLYSEDLY